MTSARFSFSLVGVVGVFVAVLAAASLWLVISDPGEGRDGRPGRHGREMSRRWSRRWPTSLYDALQGIIKYL